MVIQFMKSSVRRIIKYKQYSLISILSLAIGMVTCILVFGFIRYERGFDRMHHDSAGIYRLHWSVDTTDSRFATFFNPMAPVLAEAFPEIQQLTRIGFREHELTVGDTSHQVNLAFVDNDFFRFFNYPALQQDPDRAIRDAGSIILTEAAAQRLFGRSDVAGETLTVDAVRDFRVGAVVANNPANSHLGFNIFVNIETLPALWEIPDFWTRAGYVGSDVLYSYVRLAPGTDPTQLESDFDNHIRTNLVPDFGDRHVHLQPLTDIHFNPDLQNELPMLDDMLGTVKPLRKQTDILLFSSIAVLTLAIAALNFMNLQAVQFTRQIREVGVRRVIGSSYSALALQFLLESALISLFALLLTVPLYELLAPTFYGLLGVPAGEANFLTLPMVLFLCIAAMLLGMLVALYPALSTARIAPVIALRGEWISGRNASMLRSVLIVLQFTISIGLIVGSFTVKNQIDYALRKSLGFDPQNVLTVELPPAGGAALHALMKSELIRMPGVAAVAAGTGMPARSLADGAGYVPESGNTDEMLVTRVVSVSDDYFDALGMTLVAGRALSEDFSTDRKPPLSEQNPLAAGGMILNETAARQAGWNNPAEAIGRHFYQTYQVNGATWINDYTIVGVVADAHFGSIRRVVEPVSFVFPQELLPNVLTVRLSGDDHAPVLAVIDALWREQVPQQPIRRSFLADDYVALYAGEERSFAMFIVLALLAVLIACSGLYGLASYVAERRTKEIGVRKVMGSSALSIVVLLTNDFSKLVLLSNVIAWPVAYFAMQRWLENFAYRIDLTPLVFIGSGLIALCIAWVTVGGTAAKAASRKPVLALRYE